MPKHTYSLYEAKAKLSALVRQVRDGGRVIITVHGEPAVEIRAVEPTGDGIEARLDELRRQGVILPATHPRAPMKVGVRRPGGLKRFLDSRD